MNRPDLLAVQRITLLQTWWFTSRSIDLRAAGYYRK
jgi:hypothetical protein